MGLRKKIKNWNNYEVDEEGNVFSLNYRSKGKEQKMKPNKDSVGYFRVSFRKPKIFKTKRVHRLVAETFIPNPQHKKFVNHKNGNKLDNRVSNLEWCSRSENEKHAFKIGLKSHVGEKHNKSKLTEDNVKDIRLLHKIIKRKNLSNMFNVSIHCIDNVIYRKSWRHVK